MVRLIAVLVLVGGVGGAIAAWVLAGDAPGPTIEVVEPSVVGQTGQLTVRIDTPRGELTGLSVELVQGEARTLLYSLSPATASALIREGDDGLRLTQPLGKSVRPELRAGRASIEVRAVRPVLFGYREARSSASHDFDVRLAPPVLGVMSQLHYINHGGSEVVVYHVSPEDAESGVRVGEIEYPGYPATGAGIKTADPGLRVAFFAVLWDQDPATPITLYARDALGNEASAPFDKRVFAKTFRHSNINITDSFLSRVVPSILQNSPDFTVDDASDLLAAFVKINNDMRRDNAAEIVALAAKTAPEVLWHGAFKQLTNTAVESSFADQRTYYHDGQVIDHQVHLGFDLASVAAAPVLAANSGRIVHAGWLGIYGNCVIIDHGMGLQSLYAHLSSIEVAVGDDVERDEEIGRSGSTGLAGGDHLHFTMLLDGHAVTPIDWWSPQWVADRITRKFREAEGL